MIRFSLANITLIFTATTTALMAGLFYSYTCSVNIGLGRLTDKNYLLAMQSINSAIQNPLFFAGFMGALILLPYCAYLNYQQPISPRFMWLAIASVTYIIGVFGITVAGNVPLNEALAHFNIHTASTGEITAHRLAFEKPWNFLHGIRTLASVISLISVIISCLAADK